MATTVSISRKSTAPLQCFWFESDDVLDGNLSDRGRHRGWGKVEHVAPGTKCMLRLILRYCGLNCVPPTTSSHKVLTLDVYVFEVLIPSVIYLEVGLWEIIRS